MGYTAQTPDDIRENLAEQLDPNFAERNDEAVAQALYAGEPVDAVYTVDEAELLSGFFDFLRETGIMVHWQTFRIEGIQRVFLPTIYFVLLYNTRVLFGIGSTNALPSLLFSNLQVQTDGQAQTETQSSPPTLLAHSLLGGQGILRWQRELAQESRDKVIVFIGNQYGIFNIYELLVLVGVVFRHPPPHLDPPEAVLRRYRCDAKPRASPI